MNESEGRIVAICTSAEKHVSKESVPEAILRAGHGLEGDAHAGNWHRQVSLLAQEAVHSLTEGKKPLEAGAFGENLLVSGLGLDALEIGRRIRVGEQAVLQITQRGKACHDRCAIYQRLGDCVMPRQGLFARVRRGGPIAADDRMHTDPELDRLRFAVVTLSDRGHKGERVDRSGPVVVEMLEQALGGSCLEQLVLPDEQQGIQRELVRLCDDAICDMVVTTGGTGLGPRDRTPEATAEVMDRSVPGMAEAIRAAGLAHTPRAMLSRGLCALRGQTLIINLSGSPRAAREQLEVVLPVLSHALETASGIPQDCAR